MAWSASIECAECGGIAKRETIYAVLSDGTNIWISMYYCHDCGRMAFDDYGTINRVAESKCAGGTGC